MNTRLSHAFPIVLTAKQVAGLVYVGIAFFSAGVAAVETSRNVQWFSTAQSLDPHIGGVIFHLDGQPLGYPYLIVQASLRNPSSYSGLSLSGANYAVFVNSTTESFTVAGSSEVVNNVRGINRIVPAGITLNITSTFPIHPDEVNVLRSFLDAHNQTDLVLFAGVTLYLNSVYGTFSIPYCYQFPGNTIAYCPSSRAPSGTGMFGGG